MTNQKGIKKYSTIICTLTGLGSMNSWANWWTDTGHVALNIIIWRTGKLNSISHMQKINLKITRHAKVVFCPLQFGPKKIRKCIALHGTVILHAHKG